MFFYYYYLGSATTSAASQATTASASASKNYCGFSCGTDHIGCNNVDVSTKDVILKKIMLLILKFSPDIEINMSNGSKHCCVHWFGQAAICRFAQSVPKYCSQWGKWIDSSCTNGESGKYHQIIIHWICFYLQDDIFLIRFNSKLAKLGWRFGVSCRLEYSYLSTGSWFLQNNRLKDFLQTFFEQKTKLDSNCRRLSSEDEI